MSSYDEPVRYLAQVVKMAEERMTIGNLLCAVRRIDESDINTLKRLIEERAKVVQMLRDRGIPHDHFDWDYKDYGAYINGVEKVLGPK